MSVEYNIVEYVERMAAGSAGRDAHALHDILRLREESAARVKELEGIVARMPHTKDGAPITFRFNMWTRDITQDHRPVVGCGAIGMTLVEIDHDHCDYRITIRTEDGTEFEVSPGDLFSTQDAANAEGSR